MTTVAPLNSAPMTEMCSNPRIVPPQTAENLAGSFLPRGFTVSRAAAAAGCPCRAAKRDSLRRRLSLYASELLIILAIEEARDVDRLPPVIALAFIDLRLG